MTYKAILSRVAALAATLAVLFVGAVASATTAIFLPREQLVAQSEWVVHARAVEAKSAWSADGAVIVTRTLLDVVTYGKGKGPSQLVLEQIGGTVDDKTMVVAGDGRVVPGDEVVLFLARGEDADVVHLTALAQATYVVKNGQARRDLRGLSLFSRSAGALVEAPRRPEPKETVAQLLADVAKLARRPK